MATFSYTQLPVIGESSSAAASHIIDSFQKIAAHVNGANVDYTNIANNAVRTVQIQDASVTFAKLDATVGSEAVQTSVIKDGAVTFAKLNSTAGSEAVQTSVIKDSAVTSAKIDAAAKVVHYSGGLPAGTSWTDGQRISIPAPGTNGGIWTLQWSATETTATTPSATTGAWMFVGGPPAATSSIAAGFSTSAYTTNGAVAFSAPSPITLPNKGLYEIYVDAVVSFDAGSGTNVTIGGKFGHGLGAGTTGATDMETYASTIQIIQATAATPVTVPAFSSNVRLIQTTATPVSLFGRCRASSTTSMTASTAALRITPIKLLP